MKKSCLHENKIQPNVPGSVLFGKGYVWKCADCGQQFKYHPQYTAKELPKNRSKVPAVSKQIQEPLLRQVAFVVQGSGFSTSTIVEHFMPSALYEKLYAARSQGIREGKSVRLTPADVNEVSYALTSMANTLAGACKLLPKQIRRKGEK